MQVKIFKGVNLKSSGTKTKNASRIKTTVKIIPFMYQCRLVKATVVILTKEESHNNSNISECKM